MGWFGEEVGARWSLLVGGVPTLVMGIVTYPILARVDRCRSARRAEPASTADGSGADHEGSR